MAGIKQIIQDNLIQKALKDYQKEVFLHRQAYKLWMYRTESKEADFVWTTELPAISERDGYIANVSYKLYPIEEFHSKRVLDTNYDYLFLAKKEGMFCKDFEAILAPILTKKEITVLYGDEDLLSPIGRMTPWFKPDYSPNTLMDQNYFGSFVMIRMDYVKACLEAGYCNSQDFEVNAYELILRTVFLTDQILHVDKVLYHKFLTEEDLKRLLSEGEELSSFQLEEKFEIDREVPGTDAKYNLMKEKVLRDNGINAKMIEDSFGCFHPLYVPQKKEDWPFVSIIIPSKDHPDLLEACIRSLYEKSTYKNIEIIVMDNGSTGRNRATLSILQQKYPFTMYYEPAEFNFSKMCNSGAKKAKGSYLFFLNDDTTVEEADSIERMVGQASLLHVGAVGAKLLYPHNQSIQHAGVTNMETGPSHKLIGQSDTNSYYHGRNRLTYDCLAVTAACMMIRREVFQKIGGFDEKLKIAYNDVELCFRLYEGGYINVLRNDAVFIHYESFSRGNDTEEPEKWERLLKEREKLYLLHPKMYRYDPFYSKHLTGNLPDYLCRYVDLDDLEPQKITKLSVREEKTAVMNETIRIQVDYADIDKKLDLLNENALILVEGWCYLQGLDNARYSTNLLLFEQNTNSIYKAPIKKVVREDVTKILPNEKNIEMSGFLVRFDRLSLPTGDFKVGIMAKDKCSRQVLMNYSDVILKNRG